MAKKKGFKKFVELRASEFHKSNKKKMPELKTVDFRSKKRTTLSEQFLGQTHEFPMTPFGKDPKRDTDFEERLKNHYHDHNEDHNKAVRKYTKCVDDISPHNSERNDYHASEAVNGHLRSSKIERHQEPHAYKPQVHHLDNVTSSHKAPEDFHVYSGLHDAPKPGETHLHHGYISTSVDPTVAYGYAHHVNERHEKDQNDEKHEILDKHMLKLKMDKGSTHGYYIGERPHLSEYHQENEFLVGRGKKIHIHPEPEIREHKKTNVDWNGKPFHTTKRLHIWHGKIVDE